jgi:hypothetical protein
VLTTKHGKLQAVGPALRRSPGLRVRASRGLDTDVLGTFDGAVHRPGPPRETAVRKAWMGIEACGVPRAVASEGAFGPHPRAPFLPGGVEWLAFVDAERDLVVVESAISSRTNFAHTTARELDEPLARFLGRIGFPAHAVTVSPNRPAGPALAQGLRDRQALDEALRRAVRASDDGNALVVTDMRADRNPTRMREIAALADVLAARLTRRCPECAAPGFGVVEVERGLPCAGCGTPTDRVAAEILACGRCPCRRRRPREDGVTAAAPGECPRCNP